MRIKYLISILAVVVLFAGCELVLNNSKNIEITITPESGVIKIVPGETVAFSYVIELKTDTPVTIKRYAIEYFDSPNGNLISSLTFNDNITEAYLQKTADKVTMKNIQFVTPAVKTYMASKSLLSVYAKVHFYYVGSAGDEKEKPAPLVEIRGDDTYPEVTAINAYDEDVDGRFDTLRLTVNKDLDASSIGSDRLVDAWEITAGYVFETISYASKVITIKIKKTDLVMDTSESGVPKLQYTREIAKIKDLNSKELNSFTFKSLTIKDNAGPVIASAKKSGKDIIIKFSEIISKVDMSLADIEKAFKITPSDTNAEFTGATNISLGTSNLQNTLTISGITPDITTYTKIRLENNTLFKDKNSIPAGINGLDVTFE